jgi:hypothetical protein
VQVIDRIDVLPIELLQERQRFAHRFDGIVGRHAAGSVSHSETLPNFSQKRPRRHYHNEAAVPFGRETPREDPGACKTANQGETMSAPRPKPSEFRQRFAAGQLDSPSCARLCKPGPNSHR